MPPSCREDHRGMVFGTGPRSRGRGEDTGGRSGPGGLRAQRWRLQGGRQEGRGDGAPVCVLSVTPHALTTGTAETPCPAGSSTRDSSVLCPRHAAHLGVSLLGTTAAARTKGEKTTRSRGRALSPPVTPRSPPHNDKDIGMCPRLGRPPRRGVSTCTPFPGDSVTGAPRPVPTPCTG